MRVRAARLLTTCGRWPSNTYLYIYTCIYVFMYVCI